MGKTIKLTNRVFQELSYIAGEIKARSYSETIDYLVKLYYKLPKLKLKNETLPHFLGKVGTIVKLLVENKDRYSLIETECYLPQIGLIDVYALDRKEWKDVAIEICWKTPIDKEKIRKLLKKGWKVIIVGRGKPKINENIEFININDVFKTLYETLGNLLREKVTIEEIIPKTTPKQKEKTIEELLKPIKGVRYYVLCPRCNTISHLIREDENKIMYYCPNCDNVFFKIKQSNLLI